MDKTLVLKEIKKYYCFKSDAEFSRFLGITPQNLTQWYSRNTYDVHILAIKCKNINSEWLLTGEGEMLKKDELKKSAEVSNVDNTSSVTMPREVFDLIVSQQKTIESQQKDAEKLTNSFLSQQKAIESLVKKVNAEDAKGVVKMEVIG